MSIDFNLAQVPWYSYVLIISGLSGLLILGIGRFFSYYNVTYSGNWELKIEFTLPKSRKWLLLGIPPKLGQIKAQVVYKYGGSRTPPCDAKWEGEASIWTNVEGEGARVLHMWQWTEQGQAPLDNSEARLPNRFKLLVYLIRQRGNTRIGKPFEIPITIDHGSLTKEGFLPKDTLKE